MRLLTLISIAPRTWTRSEYQRLGELGVFEDDRVELFRGQIVQMSPQDPSPTRPCWTAHMLCSVVRVRLIPIGPN